MSECLTMRQTPRRLDRGSKIAEADNEIFNGAPKKSAIFRVIKLEYRRSNRRNKVEI